MVELESQKELVTMTETINTSVVFVVEMESQKALVTVKRS